MTAREVRIGAVSYLNTRPLVFGLERSLSPGHVLSYATPAVLADRLASGELDLALIPVIELANIPGLEIVPGLSISCRGATRSVLLVTRVPIDEVRRVALDAESRTSNALCRLLLSAKWSIDAELRVGPGRLDDALREADAVVRIGDKALFETVPTGCSVIDLGTEWTDMTGLPFVFAVWAGRPGIVDRRLYRALHASRREGSRNLETIADRYAWSGRRQPDVALDYLRHHIRFRLGSDELRALESFLGWSSDLGIIERAPEIRLALGGDSACHVAATRLQAQEER